MLRTFSLSSLILILGAVLQEAGPQHSGPLSLAVVRSDGILVPFAVHDGTSWINPWPAPADERGGAPERLFQDVRTYWRQERTPTPDVWRLWHPNGGPSLELRVLSTVGSDDHCQKQIGLLTDFRDVTDRSVRKILASHGVAKVEQPLDLRSDHRTMRFWKDLVDHIRASFPQLEDDAIGDWEAKTGREMTVPAPHRTMRPIQLRALYADRSGDRPTVYFEAVRDYGVRVHNPENPDPCHARMHIRGWVVADAGGAPAIVGPAAILTDCDEKTVVRVHPLGILAAGGERVWAVQQLAYESESYAVLSAGAGIRRLLETPGGGC